VVAARWLEPLLGGRAYDALAKELLDADPGLKKRYKKGPRPLGNSLRKLDAGEEWGLMEKEWFPPLLAQVLRRDVSELHQRAREAQAGTEGHIFRLDDLGGGVHLDLRAEGPFPGVPAQVLEPRSWGRVWWFAPSGAGKDLVAHWFAVNRRVAVHRGPSWREIDLEVDDARPAFVVVDRGDGYSLPSRARLCVAAPFLPPDRDKWVLVQTPPLEEWLDDLLGWVEKHLPEDGEFDRNAAKTFVEAHRDAFETPGHVLGLCGLGDRVGSKTLRRMDFPRLAQECVRLVAGRAVIDDKLRATLARRGGEVVESICRGLACRVERVPSAGLDAETFHSLLPPDLARVPDVAGARALLSKPTIDGAALSRVKEKLGRGVVEGLLDMRIIEPHAAGLRLRPWIERLGIAYVVEALVAGGGDDLGDALLRQHVASLVLERLLAVFRENKARPLEWALARLKVDDPGRVAAFEGCFRAAGIAVLSGAELPKQLLKQAWGRQFEIAVSRYPSYPPLPLADWNSDEPWLHHATWVLACLAIAEKIEAQEPKEFAVWGGGPPPPALATALHQAAWSSWEHPKRPSWWQGAFDLGRRLFEKGVVPPGPLPALLVPGAVVRTVREAKGPLPEGVDVRWPGRAEAAGLVPLALSAPEPIDLRWVLRHTTRGWLDPFRDQAQRLGVPFERVIEAMWLAWATTADTSGLRFDSLSDEDQRDVWRFAPAKLFSEQPLFEVVLKWEGIPRQHLTPVQWRAFLSAWNAEAHAPFDSERDSRSEVWREMPKELLVEAVHKGLLSSQRALYARSIAWERIADDLVAAAKDAIGKDLLETAVEVPDQYRPALLPLIVERVSQGLSTEEQVRLARFWLHDYVARRLNGWREAFHALRALSEAPSAPKGKRVKKQT
jgi:hypothetical protein